MNQSPVVILFSFSSLFFIELDGVSFSGFSILPTNEQLAYFLWGGGSLLPHPSSVRTWQCCLFSRNFSADITDLAVTRIQRNTYVCILNPFNRMAKRWKLRYFHGFAIRFLDQIIAILVNPLFDATTTPVHNIKIPDWAFKKHVWTTFHAAAAATAAGVENRYGEIRQNVES